MKRWKKGIWRWRPCVHTLWSEFKQFLAHNLIHQLPKILNKNTFFSPFSSPCLWWDLHHEGTAHCINFSDYLPT